MPELRQDPITSSWVVIATERSKRPSDFKRGTEQRKGPENCAFCYGHEHQTPPEVLAFRPGEGEPNTPGWKVRVVPNKFPALNPKEDFGTRETGDYTTLTGYGVHEVIIESPDHDGTLDRYNPEQLMRIMEVMKERYQELSRDPLLRYIQIFKNHGAIAGASLEHPHFQLLATPVIPPLVQEEIEGAYKYYATHGECIYCTMGASEMEENRRLVEANENFIAFCPYFSRSPFEFWIVPRRHSSDFSQMTREQMRDLAALIQSVFSRFMESLENPPFNIMLHTAPVDLEAAEYYHWHLEVVPRLTIWAGFELGTGIYINPTPPEVAAKFLQVSPVEIH